MLSACKNAPLILEAKYNFKLSCSGYSPHHSAMHNLHSMSDWPHFAAILSITTQSLTVFTYACLTSSACAVQEKIPFQSQHRCQTLRNFMQTKSSIFKSSLWEPLPDSSSWTTTLRLLLSSYSYTLWFNTFSICVWLLTRLHMPDFWTCHRVKPL